MVSLRKSKHLLHHTEEEVYAVFLQLAIFACMLVVTTKLVISTHDTYQYQFDSNINRIFLKRELKEGTYNVHFEDLVVPDEWYDYLLEVFLKYWQNQNFATENGTVLKKPVFLKENFHVGTARLRQIRVKPQSCMIHDLFNRYFNTCFVRYAEVYEDEKPIYKGFKHYTHDKFPVAKVRGIVSKYTGPGYVVFLDRSVQGNIELLKQLEEMKWIDRATRLVVVEFVLYNANLNLFINVKLITEVLAVGTLVSTKRVSFLPVQGIWSMRHPTILATASIFYSLVLFYTAEEVWFLKAYGFYDYIRSKWNLLDCGILLHAYVSLVLSVLHPYAVNRRIFSILKNQNNDIFIDDLCTGYDVFKFYLTVCAILLWLKIFRFISFNLTMLRFSMAISHSFKDIVGFAVMFFIVFIAYSLLGLLLFSDINPGFADLSKALVTMMRMIMGDYQYQNIEKADSILGPIFFISYILFIFFILMSMFLAVISDTYVAVRTSTEAQSSNLEPLLIKIWHKFVRALKRCCCRKEPKIDEHPEVISFETDIPPRPITEDDALKEFYGAGKYLSPSESYEFMETAVNYQQRALESEEELSKLTQKVDDLEYNLELLITKMDRILQKLDAKVDEQKIAKSLGKI